ncbi:hypothetical protein AB0N21_32435 [Streptomyces sp. NPDC051080]|uniref:hypothetical protein n=1 Tax=Streptomyces sp. NPDC051080 TaxID=3157222 RepID=UPI00342FD7CC
MSWHAAQWWVIGDQQHPVPWLGVARVMIRRISAPSSWAFLATSPPDEGYWRT